MPRPWNPLFAWGFLEGRDVSVTFPRQVTEITMSANTLPSDPRVRVKAAQEITPINAPAPLLDAVPSGRFKNMPPWSCPALAPCSSTKNFEPSSHPRERSLT